MAEELADATLTRFLRDAKHESRVFKEILTRNSAQKEDMVGHYEICRQRSFKAIHDLKRKSPDPSRAVPRLSGRSSRAVSGASKRTSPFAFDNKDDNHTRWPVRPITRQSRRVLTPAYLQDYPDLKRHHDITCVFGAPISRDSAALTAF
jgi:hypothetical protein